MVRNTADMDLLPVAQIVKSYDVNGEVVIRMTSSILDDYNFKKEPVYIFFDGLPVLAREGSPISRCLTFILESSLARVWHRARELSVEAFSIRIISISLYVCAVSDATHLRRNFSVLCTGTIILILGICSLMSCLHYSKCCQFFGICSKILNKALYFAISIV